MKVLKFSLSQWGWYRQGNQPIFSLGRVTPSGSIIHNGPTTDWVWWGDVESTLSVLFWACISYHANVRKISLKLSTYKLEAKQCGGEMGSEIEWNEKLRISLTTLESLSPCSVQGPESLCLSFWTFDKNIFSNMNDVFHVEPSAVILLTPPLATPLSSTLSWVNSFPRK